jgi:hypothetical protein
MRVILLESTTSLTEFEASLVVLTITIFKFLSFGEFCTDFIYE